MFPADNKLYILKKLFRINMLQNISYRREVLSKASVTQIH